MKILFVTPSYHPHIGGVETHVGKVTEILLRRGYKIKIITGENIKYPKIRFIGLLFIWAWFIKNIKLIKKADIIHIHDVFIWYFPLRFLLYNKPIFITFHGWEEKYPIPVKFKLTHKLAEKLSWGNICVGDFISKWYGTKPDYVTYGGVNVPKSKISNLKSQKYNSKLKILFVGRLEKDIGIEIYLKALEILKKKNIDFEFEACGDGTLKEKVKEYGTAHGFVKNVSSYIQRSDIIFASSYLLILEALSFRKIVFAVYDNPVKQDYLKLAPFAKFIIISANAEKIARQIESRSENRIKWVKQQSWEKVADLYESLYHNYSIK